MLDTRQDQRPIKQVSAPCPSLVRGVYPGSKQGFLGYDGRIPVEAQKRAWPARGSATRAPFLSVTPPSFSFGETPSPRTVHPGHPEPISKFPLQLPWAGRTVQAGVAEGVEVFTGCVPIFGFLESLGSSGHCI